MCVRARGVIRVYLNENRRIHFTHASIRYTGVPHRRLHLAPRCERWECRQRKRERERRGGKFHRSFVKFPFSPHSRTTRPSSVKCHVREDAWGRRSWLKGSESPGARHACTRRESPCFPIDSPPHFSSFSSRRLADSPLRTSSAFPRMSPFFCFPQLRGRRRDSRRRVRELLGQTRSSSLLEDEENLAGTRFHAFAARRFQLDPWAFLLAVSLDGRVKSFLEPLMIASGCRLRHSWKLLRDKKTDSDLIAKRRDGCFTFQHDESFAGARIPLRRGSGGTGEERRPGGSLRCSSAIRTRGHPRVFESTEENA